MGVGFRVPPRRTRKTCDTTAFTEDTTAFAERLSKLLKIARFGVDKCDRPRHGALWDHTAPLRRGRLFRRSVSGRRDPRHASLSHARLALVQARVFDRDRVHHGRGFRVPPRRTRKTCDTTAFTEDTTAFAETLSKLFKIARFGVDKCDRPRHGALWDTRHKQSNGGGDVVFAVHFWNSVIRCQMQTALAA